MKFMVQWSIDQDKWLPVLEKWTSMTPEERGYAGEGVKIVGRWHDLAGRTGVAIVEARDAGAMAGYLGMWNPHMDMDVTPVLEDEDSAVASKAILAGQGG